MRTRTFGTDTRSPRAYITGGSCALASAAEACAPDATIYPDAILAGGPIDAPDRMPAGSISWSHGVRFFNLTDREPHHVG